MTRSLTQEEANDYVKIALESLINFEDIQIKPNLEHEKYDVILKIYTHGKYLNKIGFIYQNNYLKLLKYGIKLQRSKENLYQGRKR